MSSLQPPLVSPRGIERPPTDLDGLFRTFFRAQMPEPWPGLKPPAALSLQGGSAAGQRRSLVRSRFALAAGLLILLSSQLHLSGLFPASAPLAADGNRGKIEATNRPLPFKARGPRPVAPLKKAAAIPPSGVLISERR